MAVHKDAPVDIGFSRKKVMKIICIIFPLYHRITNIQCRNLNPRYDIRINRMVWDMDESGEWNGKHKGIDDYLAAIKQKEGTGAQTSALPKGEQS